MFLISQFFLNIKFLLCIKTNFHFNLFITQIFFQKQKFQKQSRKLNIYLKII